jgi:ATP synthase F1 delta subunit
MSFAKKVVRTYAKSLFTVVEKASDGIEIYEVETLTREEKKKEVPTIFSVGEELLFLRALLISSRLVNQYFQNPTYSEQEKLNLFLTIFPGLTPPLRAFLRILAERSHLSLIPEITEEYTKILVTFRNSTTVKIFTATGLKENFGILLLTTLRKITISNEIILKAAFSPRLLGGFIFEYNSKSIDVSLLKEFSFFFNEV